MIKVKINNKTHQIKRLSELTTDQFNRMYLDGNVDDLLKYLAFFVDMQYEEFIKSDIKCDNLESLHFQIFDVNPEEVIKREKEVLEYKGQKIKTEDIQLNNVGKHYLYDMYFQLYRDDRINIFELSVRALAIAFLPEDKSADMSEAENIYRELKKSNWMQILPVGFFLFKRYKRKRISSWRLWIHSTLILKAIHLKALYSTKKASSIQKKQRSKNYAKY